MPLEAGVRLGTFEILEPIGAGGMGEVYRARDRRLGRDVAIKILPEAFGRDPARVVRFEREARLLAALNHPGVGAIYGAEEAEGLRYLVLELVPGETLAERLARGPLATREALEISRQITEALDAAHEKGVVHRDLKPSNVKITPEGKVKVLDFGLAKAVPLPRADGASETPTLVADPSAPGVILGTIEFMSPEQARGAETDRRTDLWSFGCILFEMLSGRRAFTGDTPSDALASILTSDPDWTRLPPGTPLRIRELLERCLQKDAARRLRDAGDATNEIERTLAELSSGVSRKAVPPPLPAPRGRLQAAMLVAAVIAIVGAGWMLLHRRAAPATSSPEERALVVLPSRDLSGSPGGQLVGDGIVETLSARLGQVPGLQVVTPTAAVAAADAQTDPLRAARSVGARYAIRSSIMRNGDQVRIAYSVWNVADRSQIASGTVDGTSADLFGIQDRLADSVTSDLKLRDSAVKTPTPTGLETASAQEKYLQALGDLQRYDKASSVEDAIRLLQSLTAENPGAPLVHAALGRAYLHKFRLSKDPTWAERGMAEAEAARKLDPKLPEVDVTLGNSLLATGQPARAEAAFRRALSAAPGDAGALTGLGAAREAVRDAAGAESSYRRAIDLHPYEFGPYSQLGGFYMAQGKYREAGDVYRRLSRMTPDSYRSFSNLGGALTMSCDYAGALIAYRRALEIQPSSSGALSNLGMTQLWTGQPGEAVRLLEEASRSSASDFRIQANLGDAYRAAGRESDAQSAYGRAIALAREQLRVNPSDPVALELLGSSLARTGHLAEARQVIDQARAADPADPNVLMDAAVVACLSQNRSEALDLIGRAVRAGYCRSIVEKIPEFAPLRSDPKFRAILAAPPSRTAGS
jgi:serine/threonine protein kinase/Flp pilus assembly protein TadD